jgi:ABC-type multidrug transport system fused ATPase/permease subunit
MDYDKVLVMKEGQVAEYNEPKELLSDRSSMFYSMCVDANLTSK